MREGRNVMADTTVSWSPGAACIVKILDVDGNVVNTLTCNVVEVVVYRPNGFVESTRSWLIGFFPDMIRWMSRLLFPWRVYQCRTVLIQAVRGPNEEPTT